MCKESKISASLIVKNEESCLENCLNSIKGVDEIIIVDTGSEDSTVEIAKKYTEKVYHGEEFLWRDDFSFSRNQSLEKCSGDWILIIDADEVLEPEGLNKIKNIIKNTEHNCVFFETASMTKQEEVHDSIRLFRNKVGVHWKGKIHNYLSEAKGEKSDIKIYYGYSKAHEKDPDRALRILLKTVNEEPNCCREKYYLAREYFYRNNYESAIEWYLKYLEKAYWLPEKTDAYLMLARCYWFTKKGDLARDACFNAIKQNPDFKEALLFMSDLFYEPWKSKWKKIADNATNKDVLFVRIPSVQNSDEKNKVTIKYNNKNFIFDGPEKDHIFSIIKKYSSFYEKDLLEEIRNLKLKGTYVDVGANIGNHSLFFSTCCESERVISIEPSNIAFKYLVNNVLSQAEVPVEFVNSAISNTYGFCSMDSFDKFNLGRTKVDEGNSTTIRTLDSILEPIPNVSLIKIDVEGFEKNVLLGAIKIIEKQHPVFCIESATQEEFDGIKEILEPLGYYAFEKKYGYTPTYIWKHKNYCSLPKIALMATLRRRANTASKVVELISPQVDKVCVVLNKVGDEDIEEWKSFFKEDNIQFYVRENKLGDAERFYPIDPSEKAYYLSVDDDIYYPHDYVDKMIIGCEKYNCLVSLHGRYFSSFPIQSYIYQSGINQNHCLRDSKENITIQFPGCGVSCWRHDHIDLSYNNFKAKNRSDIEVGRIAAKNNLPLISLAHEKMNYLYPEGKTIWSEETSLDKPETINAVNEVLELYFKNKGDSK